jgi:putative iron-regulated protein
VNRRVWQQRADGRALGAAVALAAIMSSGCDSDQPSAPPATFDASAELQNVAVGVITATYEDLTARTAALRDSVELLRAAPTDVHLSAARVAWRSARRPWEQSEAFLFGPVETQGIDPGIDSWPVNVVDLEAVLASPSPLTADFIDGLEGTLKGFHTIEYLLFDEDGQRTAAALTPRELEYLAATTESLRRATSQLAASWRPSGGNYAGQLIHAGASGSVYVSQKAAVQELAAGLVTIADEVGNGKINDPYAAQNAALEESRFSANSIADFQDNIRSILNVYRGSYGTTTGPGLHDIVLARNATLDAHILLRIQAAIDGIGAIPPPFSRALFEHGADVEAAQGAVRQLQATLQEELAPLVAGL